MEFTNYVNLVIDLLMEGGREVVQEWEGGREIYTGCFSDF